MRKFKTLNAPKIVVAVLIAFIFFPVVYEYLTEYVNVIYYVFYHGGRLEFITDFLYKFQTELILFRFFVIMSAWILLLFFSAKLKSKKMINFFLIYWLLAIFNFIAVYKNYFTEPLLMHNNYFTDYFSYFYDFLWFLSWAIFFSFERSKLWEILDNFVLVMISNIVFSFLMFSYGFFVRIIFFKKVKSNE